MHFIGPHEPIVYANASDFIMKFVDTLSQIEKSNNSQDKKNILFNDLRQKNMDEIAKLNSLEQSEIEMEMEKYYVADKDTND